MSNNGNAAERAQAARDSYGSLLDYYYERPASKESITVGLAVGSVPSADQAEGLKQMLQEALSVKEVIDNLSPAERDAMINVAKLSVGRRRRGNDAGERS